MSTLMLLLLDVTALFHKCTLLILVSRNVSLCVYHAANRLYLITSPPNLCPPNLFAYFNISYFSYYHNNNSTVSSGSTSQ